MPALLFVESRSTRLRSASLFVTLWAPSGPSGKHTTSPGREVALPVRRPERRLPVSTISHSSSPYS